MAEKQQIVTQTGLKELETELATLKTVRRKEIAEKIKEARGQGDLSENAEYDAAKEEQGQVEARIAALEKIIKNAVLIDEGELRTDIVNIGSRVTLHDEEYDENVEYLIVGSTEADPVAGKISNESPLGAALLGSAKGATVEVSAPDGMLKFTILEIA